MKEPDDSNVGRNNQEELDLDTDRDSAVTGRSEVRSLESTNGRRPATNGQLQLAYVQADARPSKSAKKKAKKKAAAARKADAIELGGSEAHEEVGANGDSNGTAENTSIPPAPTNGTPGKKKKNKGIPTTAFPYTCNCAHSTVHVGLA